jgi:hypothetical protein
MSHEVIVAGVVQRVAIDRVAGPVAARLAGPALLRFSGWWRTREWPDLLELAIRFGATSELPEGDQDLVLGSARWLGPLAPLRTDGRDFLANVYAGGGYTVDGLGRAELRAVPLAGWHDASGDREARLRAAITGGDAWVRLEARFGGELGWRPIVEIGLREVVEGVPLRCSGTRVGRGLRPTGVVAAFRRVVERGREESRAFAKGLLGSDVLGETR